MGELEAYHAEKVERLRKQTDEARYARDDALQRQKDDFANLERALVRQVEEQKAALETERREAAEETQTARLEQTEAIAVPLNDLRRELRSDEKAQTLALAAELEAWRAREENTRGELAKSETARRAAEQNAVAVYEKLAETETTVGALRGEVAELRAFKDLAPEESERMAAVARRDAEAEAMARRDEEFKTREREADRLRARVATLEEALRVSRRDSSERSVGARRAKGKRVTIREDEMDPSDGGSSASEVSDAESESDATPPPRRRRGGGADATPPSIGLGAALHRKGEARGGRGGERGGGGNRRDGAQDPRPRPSRGAGANPTRRRLPRRWSACGARCLPALVHARARRGVARGDREGGGGGGGGGARVQNARPARALEADAAANAAPDAGAGADADADETSPGTKLANAKRAVEVSSASAVKAARKVTSAGKKKRARARSRVRPRFRFPSLGLLSSVVADERNVRREKTRAVQLGRGGGARGASAGGAGGEGRGALVREDTDRAVGRSKGAQVGRRVREREVVRGTYDTKARSAFARSYVD